jgi:ADP-ribose pyrophosphatase
MPYTVLSTEVVFRGKVFVIRRDQVRHDGGEVVAFDVVDHPGAVTLIPMTSDGHLIFVKQYRHPAGERLLELPAGTLGLGEDPRACAERESREEIGLRPGRLTQLGAVFLAPGYSSELNHLFLATELVPDPLPQDPDESIEVVPLDSASLMNELASGRIRDAKTLAGLLLARPHLGPSFGAIFGP